MIFKIKIFWTSAQSWAAILAQLLILVLLSRILTPSDFGIYAVCLALVHFFMLFAEWGVGQYIIRESENSRSSKEEKLGFVLSTSLLMVASLILICLLILFINPEQIEIYAFLALLVIIPIFAIKQISFSLLQRNQYHKKTAIAELTSLSLQVISAFVLAYLYES